MVRAAPLVVCLVLVLSGCAGVGSAPQPTSDVEATGNDASTIAVGDAVTVARVVDGDTVEVRYAGGREETVRLVGVDTPEVRGGTDPGEFEGVPDTDAGRACLATYGDRASAYAERRLDGRRVRLVSDPETDRRGSFGRLLAYVVVDGEQFNYALVREGYARLYDTEFRERARYADAERAAREAKRGLWSCADGAPTTDGGTATDGPLALEAHPDADGDDNENLDDEYVTLRNVGDESLDLSGWTVSDETEKTYTFPDGTTLEPGEEVTLYTGSGTDTEGSRYWGRESAVWNNGGDTVTVRDAAGDVVLRRAV
jgi:micrococcal nuclease